MRQLQARLSLPEGIGLSLAVISPTVTAAFNITLIVQAAGPAAPLAFVIGAVAMVLVALSFMSFTHRVAHAGSAYAYVAHTFGTKLGFVAGWTLLLTYLGFGTGFAALVGSFSCAAFAALGIDTGPLWIYIGAGAMVLAGWLAYRDMRLAGRLMLLLEGAAVAGIVALCICILAQVHPTASQAAASFRPAPQYHGWIGLGFGMVYSILSYAGFEGAATLGEETIDPRSNIPIALISTVLGSMVFFIFVAYCEVAGFAAGGVGALHTGAVHTGAVHTGAEGIRDLGNSTAPLNDLALRYASRNLAIALDLAAAVSCFSGIIGGISASARILFSLGRAGLSPTLANVHPTHGTPGAAVWLAALMIIAAFVFWAPFIGAGNFYSYTSTIGTLALILIYIGVGAAEMVEAWREHRRVWTVACAAGPALLLWVLYRNVYPVPDFPNNWWPYVALAWMFASSALIKLRPQVGAAPLPDYT